jgi:hypothetical protein
MRAAAGAIGSLAFRSFITFSNKDRPMNRKMLIAGLALCSAIAFVAAANPQQAKPPVAEETKAHKIANASWCEVRQVDFKPGQRDAALKMIREQFMPAAESAGLPAARIFEYATGGRWDIQFVFPMTDGPSMLEWEISPEDEKWMASLASQCGGMDKAEALLDAYRELIASTDSQLAFERNGTAGKH